jgi:pyridoxal 5'-phosphate synthase pdxT subunit
LLNGDGRLIKVGVLALQGSYREHIRMLNASGIIAVEVRTPNELNVVDGLIIPGGESTTIGKLIQRNRLSDLLLNYNKPIWGTCAGAILLSKDIEESDQFRLGLIDATIKRNGYGRQTDSFSKKIKMDIDNKIARSKIIEGIFIRAPRITRLGYGVKSLAELGGDTVMALKEKVLITTFHPELTKDNSVHLFFLGLF